jgi:DNA-binding SARP family transcriptional activator
MSAAAPPPAGAARADRAGAGRPGWHRAGRRPRQPGKLRSCPLSIALDGHAGCLQPGRSCRCGGAVDVCLLGPVVAAGSDGVIDVGPPQRCAVLAALAVDAGKQVTVEALIDRVWGEQSPERVRRALHAHVARIRRLLEQAGGDGAGPARLVRRSGGYTLDVDPERVDVHRFRRLCEQAREPARAAAEQAALLGAALELWRGEPLAGVAGDWAARMRQAWRQQHLDAVLAWARAQLGSGNPAAVVVPLTDLAAEHPLLEPLVAVLMRALYLVGDAGQALALYSLTRRQLVQELGVEPGTELRRVHQGILREDLEPLDPQDRTGRADPGAAGTGTGSRPAGPPAVVPAQLPRDVRGFTGRQETLRHLDAMLPAAGGEDAHAGIVTLSGTAGVGKTTLAVHWAHRVRDRFPDGQLYVNLRGFDPSGLMMTAEEAARVFLETLSYRALSPAAARLFRLLGLHPGPEVSVPAAASLAGLPAAGVRAAAAGLDSHTRQLGWALGDYLPRLGRERYQVSVQTAAAAAARRLGDRGGMAATCDSIGYIHHHLGNYAAAAASYRRAIELFHDFGSICEENSRMRLGDCLQAAGDLAGARAAWQQALDVLAEVGDHNVERLLARLQAAGGAAAGVPAGGAEPAARV